MVEDLERQLARKERADLVLEKYVKLAGKRTLAFCASIGHADYMAGFFQEHGIRAVSVHSGNADNSHRQHRAEAIEALKQGSIQVIFAVDIFNEGVDIPSIDTVMFLRPTESFTVFLQQLGRGLRKEDGKPYLRVLDFVGNYKRAHYIPALLAGENPMAVGETRVKKPGDYEYPENCLVQFDFQVLDLFEAQAKSDPLKKRMRDDFFRLHESLGGRPGRVDVFEGSDIPMREYLRDGWLRFLAQMEELAPAEAAWLETPAEALLLEIERTSMTKAYKIPTIMALIGEDRVRKRVPLIEVGKEFMSFYREHPTHQKDLHDKSNRGWQDWGPEEFAQLARKNPIHYLSRSPTRFFDYDEINQVFYLSDKLDPYLGRELAEHIKDILEYRRRDYFRKRFREE